MAGTKKQNQVVLRMRRKTLEESLASTTTIEPTMRALVAYITSELSEWKGVVNEQTVRIVPSRYDMGPGSLNYEIFVEKYGSFGFINKQIK